MKGRIDKLMLSFRETNPEFYAEYKAARRIVDLRTTAAGHSSAPIALTQSRSDNGNGNGNGYRNGHGTTATELTETTR